jgi:polysaccharide biosynthesis protein PslG
MTAGRRSPSQHLAAGKEGPVRRAIAILLLVLGAAVAVFSQSRGGLPDSALPAPLGVNIHFTGEPKAELDLIKEAGFRLARMDMFWEQVERRPGAYDFAAYDALVAGLTRRSIRPLFILDYGNPLYDRADGKTLSPHTPEGQDAYARFCAAAAAHFRGKRIIWELWNEPNGFWTPRPNADDYASMALAAARAMRQADPTCTLIAPGVSGFDPRFVEHVLSRGLLTYLDAVSVHPYRDSPPETALPEFRRLRQLIDRYAEPGRQVPFACSEWGYSAAGMSEEQQGQYLARQWLTNLMAGSRLSIWYDWKNDGTDPKEKEHQFGTVQHDLRPKPAHRAAKALTQALSAYRFARRLEMGRPEDFVLLFTRGDMQALALWTTGSPDELYLPRGAIVDRATSWLGEAVGVVPRPAGPAVPLGPGPTYVRLKGASEELSVQAGWQATLESTSVDGGAQGAVRMAVSVRNPTGRPLPVAARVAAPSLLEGGWSTPVPPTVAAKQTVRLEWRGTWPLRAEQEVTVPVHLRLGRYSGRESVTFEVRNALWPEFRRRSDRVELLLHNRSREPFSGEVRLGMGAGEVRHPVRLAAGEALTTLKLAATAAPSRGGGLYDLRGTFLAPIELQRWQVVPVEPGGSSEWQVHVDGSPQVAPRQAQVSVTTAPGTDPPFRHALKCDFDLGRGWKFLRISPRQPPALEPGARRLGMWVYGDGAGGSVRCRFTDSRDQTFQPSAGEPVAWEGWRWVSMPLDGREAGFWGGPADGEVHGPVRWDSLLVFDPLGEAPRRGTLYFTGLTVEY